MIYFCLSAKTLNDKIPFGLVDRYGYSIPICDEYTVEIDREDVHPTWKCLINRGDLGEPLWSNDGSLCIIEMDLSFLRGEINSLLSVGVGFMYPENSILSYSEYIKMRNTEKYNETRN